ncbi:MAG: pentapeptide repeat-containing protein [Candidatus Thorarchaeota archaeon]
MKTIRSMIDAGERYPLRFYRKVSRGEDLRGEVLIASDMRESDLSGTDFSYANLRGVKFDDAVLNGCNFTGADLTGASLRGADLRNCNFTSARLDGARLDEAVVEGATLVDTSIIKTLMFDPAQTLTLDALENVNFSEVAGFRLNFRYTLPDEWEALSDLRASASENADAAAQYIELIASLVGIENLPHSRFVVVEEIEGAAPFINPLILYLDNIPDRFSFRDLDLKNVDFGRAVLVSADFSGALLRGAKFSNARLLGLTNFKGALFRWKDHRDDPIDYEVDRRFLTSVFSDKQIDNIMDDTNYSTFQGFDVCGGANPLYGCPDQVAYTREGVLFTDFPGMKLCGDCYETLLNDPELMEAQGLTGESANRIRYEDMLNDPELMLALGMDLADIDDD